jgi:hypothetical protein
MAPLPYNANVRMHSRSFKPTIWPWSDTIHAGMARLRHLKTFYLLCTESGRLSVRQDFEKTWCKSKVFCDGSFSSPLWRLTPALTPGLPSSTVT